MKNLYYYYYGSTELPSDSERHRFFSNITPENLKNYLTSKGWSVSTEIINEDEIYVATNKSYKKRQIKFPKNINAPDFIDSIELAVSKIADLAKLPMELVVNNIQVIDDDTIRFRIFNPNQSEYFIPFNYAVSALNGAKDLFISAACTVLKPQPHHPRMSRNAALDLINKSKFHQTEKGSFIINISCPLSAIELRGKLFNNGINTFTRQTILTINRALNDIVQAIETDNLDKLIDDVKTGKNLYLSSNFCLALKCFQDQFYDFALDLNFDLSQNINLSEQINWNRTINIQSNYFEKIEYIGQSLGQIEIQKEQEFICSVESLSGQLNDKGNRSGEVIFNLYIKNEIIKAKAILDIGQYEIAYKAHIKKDSRIKIAGKLHPGYQPRLLTDITYFELINS